jgi:hypothetical protein
MNFFRKLRQIAANKAGVSKQQDDDHIKAPKLCSKLRTACGSRQVVEQSSDFNASKYTYWSNGSTITDKRLAEHDEGQKTTFGRIKNALRLKYPKALRNDSGSPTRLNEVALLLSTARIGPNSHYIETATAKPAATTNLTQLKPTNSSGSVPSKETLVPSLLTSSGSENLHLTSRHSTPAESPSTAATEITTPFGSIVFQIDDREKNQNKIILAEDDEAVHIDSAPVSITTPIENRDSTVTRNHAKVKTTRHLTQRHRHSMSHRPKIKTSTTTANHWVSSHIHPSGTRLNLHLFAQ